MPIYSFSTLPELTAYILANIKANGNEEITGQLHQDVLISTAWSLFAMANAIPPSSVNQFPEWGADTTYEGGQEIIVRHGGKLFLFISDTNSIGTTPGTNALVWQDISAASLAHFRNRDEYLDHGGPHQVSAQQIHELLNGGGPLSSWIAPVQRVGVDSDAAAVENGWTRVTVKGSDATGLFEGHEGDIAQRVGSVWHFTTAPQGAIVKETDLGNLCVLIGTAWVPTATPAPSLAQVMAVGGQTTGTLTIYGATQLVPHNHNHVAPGMLTIVGSNLSYAVVNVNAAIVLNVGSIYIGHELTIVLRGFVTTTVAFSSVFNFPPGMTIPNSIAVDQVIVLRGFGVNGVVTVNSCATHNDVY